MPSIDERVVSMAFENQVFESRVATTMGTLTKLDASIKHIGSATGLQNIESAANKVTLQAPMSALDKLKAKLSGAGSGAAQGMGDIDRAANKVTLEGPNRAVDKLQGKMGQLSAGSTFSDIERASNQVELGGLTRALENVKGQFSVLSGAAAVAFGNIASQAATKAGAWAKSFAVGPIIDGLHEYETNLKSIQTIQANTDRPLTEINASLEELNRYSDQTIYNFSEMARNIGTFTAAGVDLKTATSSIKGIANMAALSGSSSQQAATAMYQLSQAISSGRVGLQDWNSVVNAGMGGKKLQNALAQTSVAMGGLNKESVKLEGPMKKLTINGKSFRETIMAKPGGEASWLTSDVLVNTLATLDGRFSKAALSAELTKDGLKKYTSAQVEAKIATARTALEQKNGVKYTDEQFAALMKLSDSAFKSATEVKTLGQVFDVAKETIGSGWAASFQSIFGNLTEAKELFTGMSGTINGFINANALARNQVLHDWKELGGRTDLIEGIKAGFQALFAVLKPIKDAFRDIFPAKTGADLASMTSNFRKFMESIMPGKAAIEGIRDTARGFFAVLHIGWEVIKGVVGVLFDLLGVVGKGSGGFLNFTGGIGDFLVAVDEALTKGGLLKGFFSGLTAVLKIPLDLFKKLVGAIAGLFGGGTKSNAEQLGESIGGMMETMTPMEKLVLGIKNAWAKLVGAFEKTKQALEPWFSSFVDKMKDFGTLISDSLRNLDFDNMMDAVQTGLVAGLFLALKKALGKSGVVGALTDSFGALTEVFGGLTGHLEAMQKKIQAQTILMIAAAVLALAGAVYIFSKIDADDLAKAMSAVAIGLGQLMGAMKLMMGGMGKLGMLQLPIIAASMIGMAIAVTILAGAMKIFATMSWEDIAKGLVGIAGSIAAVGVALNLMGGPKLMVTALALIPLAIGLNLIAASVKIFASLSWEDLVKGLLGMASAIALIGNAMMIVPPTLPLTAAGLILLGVALNIIAVAIKIFGEMDFATMLKGLGGVTVAIAGIGLAMMLVPPTIALTAAGILIVAGAMVVLAAAITIIGNLSVGELAKGLIGMAGALVILAIGLTAMAGTLPGSVALLAAAVALAILAPTLAILGNLEWSTLIKGLAAIALTLGVLSVVGLVASAGLIQLGISLLPLAGVLVITAGAVFLFATAMQIMGAEGSKGVAVMIAAIAAFIAALPTLVIELLKGLVSIIEEIVKLAPRVLEALGKMLEMIIQFVTDNAPKLAHAIGILVNSILQVLVENVPKIQAAGIKLLMGLLDGISQNIGQVTTKVAQIIVKFLTALTAEMPKIQAAGFRLLMTFLFGILRNIPQIVATVGRIITAFINAVSNEIPRIVAAAGRLIVRFIDAVANQLPKIIAAGTRLILKFLEGVQNAIPIIIKKGLLVAREFLDGLAEGLVKLSHIGFQALIKFLNGLENSIRQNMPQLIEAGLGIADAIVDGIKEGFGLKAWPLQKALQLVFSKLPGWAKDVLGIHSPSSVFAEIGGQTMMGFAQGVDNNAKPVYDSAGNIAKGTISTFKDVLGVHSPSEVMKEIGKEVGTGFKQGLDGSAADIRSAFGSLRTKIHDEIVEMKGTIKEQRDQLAELEKSPGKNRKEIAELRTAIRGNTADLHRLTEARRVLNVGLLEEKNQLIGLSKQYAKVSEDLDEATKVLDDATAARDAAEKSYIDKYSDIPDISELISSAIAEAELTDEERRERAEKARIAAEKRRQIDQVANYKQALRDKIEATKKYAETLQRLRALGLDDATYRMLLEEGTAGQEFADQLLAGGQDSINEINSLDSELLSASTTLAKDAAKNLYQAGVDAAQGLVDGLKAKKAELQVEMENLATMMVRSIKRQLGIRSPSKIFAEIGNLMTQGLTQGLTASTSEVSDAASKLGTAAVSAIQRTVDGISAGISTNIDVDPTITPVLDLSQVERDAKKLGGLTNVTPITAAASYGQATAISDAQQKALAESGQAAQAGNVFNYEQNNYSPEKLSDVEIYRQTKNQLSQVKSALGLTS